MASMVYCIADFQVLGMGCDIGIRFNSGVMSLSFCCRSHRFVLAYRAGTPLYRPNP